MNPANHRPVEALFTRISALSTANLRISASLDVTTVQNFPRAGARSLGKFRCPPSRKVYDIDSIEVEKNKKLLFNFR